MDDHKKFNSDAKAKIIARSRAAKRAIAGARAREIDLSNTRNRRRAWARRRARARDKARAEFLSMVLGCIVGVPIILVGGTIYFITWPIHTGLRKIIC